MDNIIIEKIMQDQNLVELNIKGNCNIVNVFQTCYVDVILFEREIDKIINYCKNYDKECYIQFGEKNGNFTPAFSMCIFPATKKGNVTIEVDFEIVDNNERKHRCSFYVNSEFGSVERFAYCLKDLTEKNCGFKCSLASIAEINY